MFFGTELSLRMSASLLLLKIEKRDPQVFDVFGCTCTDKHECVVCRLVLVRVW